jgi:hypothetical protein
MALECRQKRIAHLRRHSANVFLRSSVSVFLRQIIVLGPLSQSQTGEMNVQGNITFIGGLPCEKQRSTLSQMPALRQPTLKQGESLHFLRGDATTKTVVGGARKSFSRSTKSFVRRWLRFGASGGKSNGGWRLFSQFHWAATRTTA